MIISTLHWLDLKISKHGEEQVHCSEETQLESVETTHLIGLIKFI